jgi:hypothetical protein
MHHRTTRAFAATVLALTLGACIDGPTSPANGIVSAGPPARSASVPGPTLIPNSVRYRDNGGKPARGRSGTAELEALALLAKDGTVTVESRARSIDPAVTDTGTVSKLQVKASTTDGTPKFVRNLNGASSTGLLELRGLSRGDHLQLQANVRGLDGNRTDVVTVTETVKRLPDLRVAMSPPAEAALDVPVNVFALISEGNGDVGATARCELHVNGQLVDHADGVWVDAGDAVTCALTTSIAAAGTYPVEVRVSTVGVADWDASDNVAHGTIQVSARSSEFETWGSFSQISWADTSSQEHWFHNALTGQRGEATAEGIQGSINQWAEGHGWLPVPITEPADLRISMSTGGRVIHQAEWTQLGEGMPWGWCVDLYDGPAMFFLCTSNFSGQVGTSFSYYRIGGAVTYHSRSYSREWDEITGEDYFYYHENESYGWDDTVPAGDDWSFDVRLSTASAEYPASLTLSLFRTSRVFRTPYSCTTVNEEWGYSATTCGMRAFHEETIASR